MTKCLTAEEITTLPPRERVVENIRNLILKNQEQMRVIANRKSNYAVKSEQIRPLRMEIEALQICLRHLPGELDREDLQILGGGFCGDAAQLG